MLYDFINKRFIIVLSVNSYQNFDFFKENVSISGANPYQKSKTFFKKSAIFEVYGVCDPKKWYYPPTSPQIFSFSDLNLITISENNF